MSGAERRVMVVCTGNIARSPMGERLLRSELGEDSSWAVDSTGVGARATAGMGMYPPMAKRLEALGVSAEGHAAKQLTYALADQSDLILALDNSHRTWILEEWPAFLDRTVLLHEAASIISAEQPESIKALVGKARHGADHEVADPYMCDSSVADAATARIRDSVAVIGPWLNDLS